MNLVTGLSAARIALGTSALLAPDLTVRVLGMNPTTHPELASLGRLFGSREIVLGAITLAAKSEHRRPLVAIGVAVDIADALTAAVEFRRQAITPVTAAAIGTAGLGATAVGVTSLVHEN